MVSQRKSKKTNTSNVENVVNVNETIVNTPIVDESIVNTPIVNESELNLSSSIINDPNSITSIPIDPVVNLKVQKGGSKKNSKTNSDKTVPKVKKVKSVKKTEDIDENTNKVQKTNSKKIKTENNDVIPVINDVEEIDDGKARSFKVKLPNDEDFTGRFTGLTPYQAANKALSKYFRNNENNNITTDQVLFCIKESTRGSKRHEYTYKGTRIKLDQPITYTIKSADGNERIITKQYKNQLTKVKKGNNNVEIISTNA